MVWYTCMALTCSIAAVVQVCMFGAAVRRFVAVPFVVSCPTAVSMLSWSSLSSPAPLQVACPSFLSFPSFPSFHAGPCSSLSPSYFGLFTRSSVQCRLLGISRGRCAVTGFCVSTFVPVLFVKPLPSPSLLPRTPLLPVVQNVDCSSLCIPAPTSHSTVPSPRLPSCLNGCTSVRPHTAHTSPRLRRPRFGLILCPCTARGRPMVALLRLSQGAANHSFPPTDPDIFPSFAVSPPFYRPGPPTPPLSLSLFLSLRLSASLRLRTVCSLSLLPSSCLSRVPQSHCTSTHRKALSSLSGRSVRSVCLCVCGLRAAQHCRER